MTNPLTYSVNNLPPLKEESEGYAFPIPQERIAIPVQKGTKILAPWEFQVAKDDRSFVMIISANIDTSNPQSISFFPNGQIERPRHDWFINNETLDHFFPTKRITKGMQALGDILFEEFPQIPHAFIVQKVVPIHVLGQIKSTNPIRLITQDSENTEGAIVPPESYILKSLTKEDAVHFNTKEKFEKLYQAIIKEKPSLDILREIKMKWRQYGFE